MKKKESALQFYQDTLVIQAAFGDARLMKYAEEGVVDQIISAVKNYISGHIKEDDKVGSAINILAPGFVYVMLRSLGLGWLAFIASLAMEVFNVDINSYIQEILAKLLPKLKSGEKVTPEEVKNATDAAFAPEIAKEPTKEELAKLDQYKKSYTVREALLYKIAMEEAVVEYKLTKNAGIFDLFKSGKSGTVSLLSKAIKWIFIIVLASCGLMVAGDIVNKVLGRPNAFDGSLKGGQPAPSSAAPAPVSVSKQTKFKVNTSYDNRVLNSGSSTWTEAGTPNVSNITNTVLDWMNEVYEGTNQFENIAANSIGFKNVVDEIIAYNSGNRSGRIIYIPRMFPTKKSAVDLFIDEVAEKSGPSKPSTLGVKPSSK